MQSAAISPATVRPIGQHVSRRRLGELSLLLFMLPALLLVLLFVFVPTLWAIVISFTNQSLIGPNARNFAFIGFDNYVRLFADPAFWNSLGLSFLFVFASAFLGQFVLGLLLAVSLRRAHISSKGVVGGAVLLAWVVPEIVAVYIWASVFNFQSGTANQLLMAFGFERHRWLIDTPMLAIILVNVWRGTAFTMLLFSAALESIPDELFDAAAVDGASAWQKFRFITVPMLRYTILLDFILITMGTFSVFGLVFALTGGGPLGRSEIIGVYIYRSAFQYREVGFGSAASVIMLLINLTLALTYLRLLRVEQEK